MFAKRKRHFTTADVVARISGTKVSLLIWKSETRMQNNANDMPRFLSHYFSPITRSRELARQCS